MNFKIKKIAKKGKERMPKVFSKYEICELNEFLDLLSNNCPLEKLFTKSELKRFSIIKSVGSLAARWLIKRSLLNILTLKNDHYLDIEILNDEYGKPEIELRSTVKERSKELGIESVICSLSHTQRRVAGMIVINYKDNSDRELSSN